MSEHNMNDPLDLDGLDQLFGDGISMPSAADYMRQPVVANSGISPSFARSRSR